MVTQDAVKRAQAAYKILQSETTSLEKFGSLRELLSGISPAVDIKLEKCAKLLSTIENLQKGDVITLSAENLPAETEEENRRKKALILFLKSYKDLRSEVVRIKNILKEQKETPKDSSASFAKILTFAKGPFGIVTILAILIAGSLIFANIQTQTPATQTTPLLTLTPSPIPKSTPPPTLVTSPKTKIKVIVFENKKIPVSELAIGSGPECTNSPQEAPHYHAKDHQAAKTLDGTTVSDPGGCGFGKVKDVPIEEVSP